MENKLRIVLINHSFQKEYYYRRWQLFAQNYKNVEVYLLTPAKVDWYATKEYTFSGAETVYGKVIDEENFHIRLFRLNFSVGVGSLLITKKYSRKSSLI